MQQKLSWAAPSRSHRWSYQSSYNNSWLRVHLSLLLMKTNKPKPPLSFLECIKFSVPLLGNHIMTDAALSPLPQCPASPRGILSRCRAVFTSSETNCENLALSSTAPGLANSKIPTISISMCFHFSEKPPNMVFALLIYLSKNTLDILWNMVRYTLSLFFNLKSWDLFAYHFPPNVNAEFI